MNLITVVTDSLQDVMDSQKGWNMFLENKQGNTKEMKRKYCRLNVPLSEVPRLDQVDRMDELQSSTETRFKSSQKIKSVSATFIASLFYLEELWGPQNKNFPNQCQYTGK